MDKIICITSYVCAILALIIGELNISLLFLIVGILYKNEITNG